MSFLTIDDVESAFVSGAVAATCLSLVSSVFLALVVVFDRVMVADCYRGRPDQAWLVSSLAGAGLGLVASAIAWAVVAWSGAADVGALAELSVTDWPRRGLLIMISGAIAVQVIRHYFRLFAPLDDLLPVNETAIAMWLASAPVFIYAGVAMLQAAGVDRGLLAGLDEASVSWRFGGLVALTVFALLRFEAASATTQHAYGRRRYTQISLLTLATVIYTVLLSAVLRSSAIDLAGVVALLPFYWIGFAAGGRLLAQKSEREAFRQNWRRMKRFLGPIVVSEILGMGVFFSELFALGNADPTLVNLIISSHVLLVFAMALGLARLRRSMESQGLRRRWILGVRFTPRRLPESEGQLGLRLRWLAIAVAGLMATIVATS